MIVGDIQLILNDTGIFWPAQQILDATNEAQFHIYAETKWAITSAPLALQSNTDLVQIPPAILIPKWIEGTNSNFQPPVVKRFFPTTMRNLEHFLRSWRGANLGQPVYFIQWDATHWRVFPRPDGHGPGPGGAYPFTIFGVGFPPELTSLTQPVLGPLVYQLAVQNYATSLLLEATRPDLADLYLSQADQQVLNFKKQLRNQQSHNLRVLRPVMSSYEIDQLGQVNETPSYYPLES